MGNSFIQLRNCAVQSAERIYSLIDLSRMNKFFYVACIFVIIISLQNMATARPNRVKRFLGDQSLARSEAINGLKRLHNKVIVSIPVSKLSRDYSKIGRKRRSQSVLLDALFNQLEEDTGGSPHYKDFLENISIY